MEKQWKQYTESSFSRAPKLLQMVIAAMKLKDACSFEEKLWPISVQFSSVQSLSRVRLFATPWNPSQASLSITNSRSSFKLMSIKSGMPSSHLILCRPLLLLPPIPPSIRVFSNESTLRMRWTKYWIFTNLESILKIRDITLLPKSIVKALVFQ